MSKQRKYRVTATAVTEFYPNGKPASTQSFKETFYAIDEADALEQAKGCVGDDWKDFSVSYVVEPMPFWFECEIKDVKNLRWWEEKAVDAAVLECKGHWPAESLEDVAQHIEDGWSESCARDGEPGPQPGNVDFDINKAGTKLTIRSTRVLAVVTMHGEEVRK